MIEGILFDLDGTLVWTDEEYIHKVVSESFNSIGVESISKKESLEFWFSPDVDEFVSEYTSNLDGFWQTLRSVDTPESRMKNTKPYDDIQTIKELKLKGLKTGVITSAPKPMANMEIDLIGSELFDLVVYAQPKYGFKRKPDPEAVIFSMDRLGLNKKGTSFVGNAIEDVLMAKYARILDVHIKRPNQPCELNGQPTVQIESLYELI